jgi:hypothetical protein
MQKTFFFKIVGLIFVFGIVIFSESCRKNPEFNTDPNFRLEFSNDTIRFDTVFTSFGSTTLWLKVYNRSDKDVDIRNIELVGREASFFRMNVNGDTSLLQTNIRLRAKDSLHIFIKVTINPNDENNPFEVLDYIRFSYNNRSQEAVLLAFGQNAIYHIPKPEDILEFTYNGDTLCLPYSIAVPEDFLTAEKPHVIYGYLLIESGDELILKAGTRLHFAPDAGLIVREGGSLKIRGEFEREVILEGMRMDAEYRNITGQWNRIWLSAGSENNEINWAIIRNGKIGLLVDSVANQDPTLIIQNTIINNMQNYGILAQGAVIRGNNLQVSNCGERLLALNIGGDYAFEHCTFANYFSGSTSFQKSTSVLLNNYYTSSDGSQTLLHPLIRADFTSCIIYGVSQDELDLDLKSETTGNYNFSYCNIRTQINIVGKPFHNCQINVNPYFKNASNFNGDFDIVFPPSSQPSGAIAKAKPLPNIFRDLKNRPRDRNEPTIGAYEFTEQTTQNTGAQNFTPL